MCYGTKVDRRSPLWGPAARDEASAASGTVPVRLDARQMRCDEAVLAAMRTIRRVEPGGWLEVVTAAESVRRDLRAWADRLGHACEGEEPGAAPGEIILRIRKRADGRRKDTGRQ